MQKQDLIEVIKKFAALKENRRSELDNSVMWDFVAADVSSLAIFKSSPFSHADLDAAMEEVANCPFDQSDIEELRRVIEKQQSKLDKMQAELSANRKKLQSIKKRPVMSRNFS